MTHKGTVTLETERLILRRFTPDDAEPMFHNWASDPDVARFMHWDVCKTLDDTQARIADWLSYFEKSVPGTWDIFALELKSNGELIGTIDYAETDAEARSAEVGYQVGKTWQGRGYATEALGGLLKYLFETIKLNRVWATHDPRNPASGAVMRKCGMLCEGTQRQRAVRKGELRDTTFHAILAVDYFGTSIREPQEANPNANTIKILTELMFHNLRIAMDTSDWNANICGAPAWRYIYHTIHSADKYFINPAVRLDEPEPPFHKPGLDWPDTPSETILAPETLYNYYGQVRKKILSYVGGLNDSQLSEKQNGCINTRLGLIMEQFRHMYAHIGILNGITIANTGQYPCVINSGTWRSANLPDGLYDVEERKY